VLVCSPWISFSFVFLFYSGAPNDSAKLLEQLMSKEVADVSAQPQSMEEMKKSLEEQGKQLEDKDRQLEDKDKVIEDKDRQLEDKEKENQAQARRIKELEALLAGQQ